MNLQHHQAKKRMYVKKNRQASPQALAKGCPSDETADGLFRSLSVT